MEENILNNLHHIRSRIEKACAASGRRTEEVKLLLATKTVSADRIAVALGAGATLIAENKLQELKAKYEALRSMPHTNHFIGHLQTNKIKELLRYDVACLQSLDRLELAEKLSQRLVLEGKTMDVLIQVNTSDEESKFGVHPDQALDLVRAVALLPNVRVRGLMTIGLFSAEEEKVRVCFQRLRAVQELVKEAAIEGVEMVELSMGMSGDLEIAIAEGATIVRVGTAVFGERQYPDSYYWKE
ncbi:YggS family pyridoxal phosphate-dependent enzyme [Sphingobacterium psychroaquaticum]|uniref:YggS family pyridoxal phosphate-dependent enzyme n=1 Tax=Sphingobacterium psychroaquaticum TaxID=561061 RepID=UPI001069EFC0|nr:YggS family pyridoxal phosphate-dependent enzyme [Sphingobacterium psychroaquaticum]QBQ40585.1 YggS family pyridoxal phosphate-dependent enzyme [Sphingobacterium psychroaquaticum]